MIGPPLWVGDPIQIDAWMLPLPAVIVAVPPLANVGHAPITLGSIVGITPWGPPTPPDEPPALASPVCPLDEPVPELLL
jgi:hypothetical protein